MKVRDFLKVYNDALLEIIDADDEIIYQEKCGQYQDWKTHEELTEEFGDKDVYCINAYTLENGTTVFSICLE